MPDKNFHEEEKLEKSYDSQLMKRLLHYARPYSGMLFLTVALLFIVAGVDLLRPYLVKIAIDSYISNVDMQAAQKISGVIRISIFFLSVMVLGFVINIIHIYILTQTGQKIIFNIRQEVFTKVESLPVSYFDKNPVGRLVTRVTNDTETLNEMYSSVLVTLFKDVLLVLGSIVGMFLMNTKLTLITILVFPFILGVTLIFKIKARDAYSQVRVKLAKLNSILSESISGMKVIHIFNRQSEKYKEFTRINDEYYHAGMNEITIYGIFRPAIELIGSLGLSLIVWYGGGSVLNGTLEFGTLYAFVNYLFLMFQPINDLTEKYNILQSAMASSERIFNLLDEKSEFNEKHNIHEYVTFDGKVEFDHVWFAYNDEEWVLKDISFTIQPGQTVAFVGATGAGKTSIINLINRFYEIQKGEIRIDDSNIRLMDKENLRKNIAVVLQDVFLFSGNIESNIRLNNDNISLQQVEEAAEYVNASNFVEKFPGKYSHEVKERGATLSAGQRQLLAFARALVFYPSILILDEATANIDTETELLIQDALRKITQNRTTIVIAHRLSTIQHADNIIVMHHGRIKEMGTHQELLANKGMYYDLYKLQVGEGSY